MPRNEAEPVKYDVIRARYSRDMWEAEFALIAPLLPLPKRRYELRLIMLAETNAKASPTVPPLTPLLPGIGLCILVAALAYLLQMIEGYLFDRPWLEALVFAILFGVTIRSTWTPS